MFGECLQSSLPCWRTARKRDRRRFRQQMHQNLKHSTPTLVDAHACLSEINVEEYHTLVGPDVSLIIAAVLKEVRFTVGTLLCTLHHDTLGLCRECICPKNTHKQKHIEEKIMGVRKSQHI